MCSKIKKLIIQDGRRRHYFLWSSGLCPGQTRRPILASDTSKNACFLAQRDASWGLETYYYMFHPETPISGARNAFHMRNKISMTFETLIRSGPNLTQSCHLLQTRNKPTTENHDI